MAIRKLLATIAIFGLLASGVGIASIMIFSNPTQQQSEPPRRNPPQPPPPSLPTADEFLIGVVVTAQNCDPAGGCVYTYTIDPKYVGLHAFPDAPFTVEYEVTGGHQPQPGNFTVEGEQAQILMDVVVEGPPGAQLQAEVLRIVEQPPAPPAEPPPGPPAGTPAEPAPGS